jgi:hypothetical protein
MLLSRAVRASWSIAAVLLVATLGRIARADNTAANEGAFQHLRALQDIASASGGNRAAGTSGYDRSAEYVAERLKEDGYIVRLEEFEFPFFEERAPPVLVTSTPGGADAGICRCSSHLGQLRLRRRDRPAALGESSHRCGVTNGVN